MNQNVARLTVILFAPFIPAVILLAIALKLWRMR